MSTNPNPESSSISNLANAAVFIFFVISASVFITAGGIVWDVMNGDYITPAKLTR